MLEGARSLTHNPDVAPDSISQLLALTDAHCVVTGGLRAGGAWAHRSSPEGVIKLDAVIEGSCWLVVDCRPPMRLAAGDVVILNGVRPVVLCSDPALAPTATETLPDRGDQFFARLGVSPDVAVIGGHIELDPASADLFASALPEVLHATADGAEAGEIGRLLERIVTETEEGRPGASFAADQHAQLLLLHVLRAGLDPDALRHPGWLRLLMDPELRPAATLLHNDPARAWGLPELAASVGMSRSHFSHRFRQAAGQPPLTYLTHWRIQLARHALRTSQTPVTALAARLGYASESSFTHAFTRVAGISPSRYRRQQRQSPP